MQKKITPKKGNSSTPNHNTANADARRILGVEPTEADRQTAAQLVALHRNPHTPDMFKHVIFQIYWDAGKHYGLPFPNHFTNTWQHVWPSLVAKLRMIGQCPTSISYTWEPSPEDEARMDAEDKEEADTRAVFDFLHDERIPTDIRNRISDEVVGLLTPVAPSDCYEVFAVAWPLALERAGESSE